MGTWETSAVIWGGTGHAKVVHQLLQSLGIRVGCVCDRDPGVTSPIAGVPVWHTEKEILTWLNGTDATRLCFAAAIGGTRGASRLAVHAYLTKMGIRPIALAHPSAWIDGTATLGSGHQVLAMAAIGIDVSLGTQCIVNTSATVDHDTRLGDGVHVMPGATIAGEVDIEDEAVIGTNATVLPHLRVGSCAIVGAGAVVTRDVAPGMTVVGVPAKPIEGRARVPSGSADPWSCDLDGPHGTR